MTAGSTASLAEFLHARALGSAPRRLVLDIAGGAVLAVVAVWARRFGWVVVATAGLSVAMYGVWAVAERHLQPETESRRETVGFLWFVVRAVSGGIGLLAFIAFIFGLLGLALGTWIS